MAINSLKIHLKPEMITNKHHSYLFATTTTTTTYSPIVLLQKRAIMQSKRREGWGKCVMGKKKR